MSLVGVGGVTVAVWALIVVISVFTGFIAEQRSKIRAGTPDMLVTELPAEQSFAAIETVLGEWPEIAASSPRLAHYGIYFSRSARLEPVRFGQATGAEDREFNYVILVGIDPEREHAVTGFGDWLRSTQPRFSVRNAERPFEIRAADALLGLDEADIQVPDRDSFAPTHPAIVLGEKRVYREARYGYTTRGSVLDLLSARFAAPTENTPQGDGTDSGDPMSLKGTFHLAGAYASPHPTLEESTAFADLEAMRTLLGHDIDLPDSVDLVSSVALRLAPDTDAYALARSLEAALQPVAPGARVLTAEAQNRVFLSAVDQERTMMKAVLFAVMLISGFLIYATINMMVVQKTRDIGILGAMGASSRAIRQVFLTTGLLVGLTGCTLGGAAGVLNAMFLPEIDNWISEEFGSPLFPRTIYVLDEIPVQLQADWVIQVLLAAFALCLLVAWLPARAAARLRPVQALSHD